MTMAYILVVNPTVLSGAGLPFGAVAFATAMTGIAGSTIAGVFGNLPFGLAPGMGLNAYFAYGVCVAPALGMNLGGEKPGLGNLAPVEHSTWLALKHLQQWNANLRSGCANGCGCSDAPLAPSGDGRDGGGGDAAAEPAVRGPPVQLTALVMVDAAACYAAAAP